MNQLLETIERNGEFEKYVEMLADRQEREQRELRRRAREMKRLELGDDYQSSDTEESGGEEQDEDSYDDELESQPPLLMKSPLLSNNASNLDVVEGSEIPPMSIKSVTNKDDVSQICAPDEIFNPLRYIALNLKELNEIQKSK